MNSTKTSSFQLLGFGKNDGMTGDNCPWMVGDRENHQYQI